MITFPLCLFVLPIQTSKTVITIYLLLHPGHNLLSIHEALLPRLNRLLNTIVRTDFLLVGLLFLVFITCIFLSDIEPTLSRNEFNTTKRISGGSDRPFFSLSMRGFVSMIFKGGRSRRRLRSGFREGGKLQFSRSN